MTDISTENLVKSIKAVLKDADLDQLSAKKIRKQLEVEFKADFTERKDEIDKLVMQLITDNNSEEEKEEGKKEVAKEGAKEVAKEVAKEGAKSKQKTTNGSSPAPKQVASPAKKGKNKNEAQDDKHLSNDEGGDDIDNNEEEEEDDDSDMGEVEDVVPKKKAKTQPASKKAKLAKKLQDDEGTRPSRRCKAQPVVRKQKKPRKESAKGNSVYSRPCALLPPLTEIMDTDRMPRPMVVKRLWEIVRERDLLDPKNKQFMLCDDEMRGLFGKRRVRMFGAMKLLKPYIKDLPKE